ncbi:MAG: glycosyltransferase family 39 protein [Acidobacteriia bacterium]|nr:glycosyltransferase family 39 protein [Terriglobia bacterium]
MLLATVALASAYIAWCMPKRGWVAHDEGALGESAIRVMAGEVPHRDFTEIYTGGLAYLDAAAFRAFGVSTMTTRWVLFAFVVPAIAAMFYVLTRFVAPFTAGACTLVAVAWSFPNYTAAMPSWYNLIFAIFAIAAMLRFIEYGNRVWLLVAGLCAGLSFLAKLPGLYLLVGILLFLVFDEQSTAMALQKTGDRRYTVVLGAGLLACLGLLFRTVHRVAGAAVIYHYFLPLAAVAALLIAHDPRTGPLADRFRKISRSWYPVIAGAAIPVVLFVYAMRGALRECLYGVFVLPQGRFLTTTTLLPPVLPAAAAAIPLIAVLAAAVFRRSRISFFSSALLAEALLLVLLKAPGDMIAYRMGTYPLWMLATPVVLIGCLTVFWRRSAVPASDVRKSVLVLCVLAACVLIQFPFSAIIYFCYVAPLVMFALIGVLRLLPRMPHPMIAGTLLAFYCLHAILLCVPTGLRFKAYVYAPESMLPLVLERSGGMWFRHEGRDEYPKALGFLREHATGGYTYCALDCPDVYFYSGLRNPTPILFDQFDDAHGRTERILSALERHSVTAIVFQRSLFLGEVQGDLAEQLRRRYPKARQFGTMQVRWR